MIQEINEKLVKIMNKYGIENPIIHLEYTEDIAFGDLSTNIAMVYAKQLKLNPKDLAEKIIIEFNKESLKNLKQIDIAGPGFINFYIEDKEILQRAISENKEKVKNDKTVLIEYTDPNIFKPFHIGHLMANSIGESLSRLIEYNGTKVIRICYPSDIGLHIAKAIWAINKNKDKIPNDNSTIIEKTGFIGSMYVLGTKSYEENENIKLEIDNLNKIIYEKSDSSVNEIYEKGRKWSLDHFEELYKILGTKFDQYYFESDMARSGIEIVKEYVKKGIFKESDNAIIFKGEDYGLHTRVFINHNGLPTYEAKELGLNTTKFNKNNKIDQSLIITGNEQDDYFKVLIKALSLINEEIGNKTKHIGHGMLRFSNGKMSSRTGNVITGESLISDMKSLVKEKVKERDFSENEINDISEIVAIGAIKYSILKSSISSNIIFDSLKSISFEGDSGPYLQYSAVRAKSVLSKVKDRKQLIYPEKATSFERLIIRFDDIVKRANKDYAPHLIATYLINLAGEFNSFYANQEILNNNNPLTQYYIELTKAFLRIMTDGLWILGIKIPEKM